MKRIKINQTKTYTQNGIFTFIQSQINLDWFNEDLTTALENEYYLGHSGNKYISVLFYNLLKSLNVDIDNDIIPVSQKCYQTLSNIIIQKFKNNWNKIYTSYFNSEYNPIHNYNMNETETINSKITTQNESADSTILDSTVNTDNDNNIYGFNSSEKVTSDNQVLKSKNNTNQTNTKNNEEIISRNKDDNFITKERSGNIGVTTSQKMLQEELDLRKFDLITRIMNDVDKVLCSQLY